MQLAYYNRGIAYSEIKEYAKAISDFDMIFALKSNGVQMMDRDFSPSVEGQGQVDESKALYQRAISKSYVDNMENSFNDFAMAIRAGYPDSSNCMLWQGVLLGRSGRPKTACEYFEKAKKAALTNFQQNEAISMITKYCNSTKIRR